ncbi:MAG: NAD-dependent epimerase/dehydratase family protein [Gammaproteobacteria bacterium]|nr:NAD-dependent epimerase/dehydratase family protein [Gammaproteobacteria bacterium]
MRALVTGATGFVGAAVGRALARAGWDLRALVRRSADRRNLSDFPVEPVEGDLADPRSLRHALEGCDALFHVAADYRLGVHDPAPLYAVNVEGTRNVLAAARDAGIGRVVHTSSVATIGIPVDGTPGDERTPVTLHDMIGHYKRSKYLGEQVALQFAREGLPVVIVNPSTPVGPGDVKPTPTGRIVLDAASGRIPAYVDTGLNVVHVDDVAAGHLAAYERGRVGERYILGGENMSLRAILAEVTGLVGRRAPRIELPYAAVLPVAVVADAITRLTGRRSTISLEGVRMARKRMYFSSEKAERELGYHARAPVEAFRDAVRWFEAQGMLRVRTRGDGP